MCVQGGESFKWASFVDTPTMWGAEMVAPYPIDLPGIINQPSSECTIEGRTVASPRMPYWDDARSVSDSPYSLPVHVFRTIPSLSSIHSYRDHSVGGDDSRLRHVLYEFDICRTSAPPSHARSVKQYVDRRHDVWWIARGGEDGLTEFANSNVTARSHYIPDPSHDPLSPTPVETHRLARR